MCNHTKTPLTTVRNLIISLTFLAIGMGILLTSLFTEGINIINNVIMPIVGGLLSLSGICIMYSEIKREQNPIIDAYIC